MASNTIDWSVLKGALTLLVISVALSGSLIGVSYYFQKRMLKEYNLFNGQFHSISNRYLSIEEEKKLISQYFPKFVELHKEGVLGKEKRLNWIEVLNNAGKDLKIPGLSYDISSRKTYKPSYPLIMGRYKLYSTTMALKMDLLHEGDLFRVLKALDDLAEGMYTVSNCELNRNKLEINEDLGRGNVSANCELIWYSVKLADGKEIEV